MTIVVLILVILGLILLPGLWVKIVMQRHAADRPDFPGTGGELARHLLDEAGLHEVEVELTGLGDHYDPQDKAVRLLDQNYNGRSVTAVAIAAHEVAHAVQDAQGYGPFDLRTKLAKRAIVVERIGGAIMLATPFIFLATRTPTVMFVELAAGLTIMAASVVIHIVTLPVEMDASFNRALPILKAGKYLDERDLPAANQVLKAAAFTYVAAALTSLLNVARWLRLLR